MYHSPCCSNPANNRHIAGTLTKYCCVCNQTFPVPPPPLIRVGSERPPSERPPRAELPILHRSPSVAPEIPAATNVQRPSMRATGLHGDGGGAVPVGAVPIGTSAFIPPPARYPHPINIKDTQEKLSGYQAKYGTVYQYNTIEGGVQVVKYFRFEAGTRVEITE